MCLGERVKEPVAKDTLRLRVPAVTCGNNITPTSFAAYPSKYQSPSAKCQVPSAKGQVSRDLYCNPAGEC